MCKYIILEAKTDKELAEKYFVNWLIVNQPKSIGSDTIVNSSSLLRGRKQTIQGCLFKRLHDKSISILYSSIKEETLLRKTIGILLTTSTNALWYSTSVSSLDSFNEGAQSGSSDFNSSIWTTSLFSDFQMIFCLGKTILF